MAIVVEYVTKLVERIRGHAPETDRSARVEDVLINNNAQGNVMCRATIIIASIIPCFFIYLFIANYILDSSHLYVTKFGIQSMHLKFNVYNDTISLDGNFSHQVSFKTEGHVKAFPDSVTYTLSTGTIRNYTLIAVSTSTFQISKDVQLITVKFEANQTGLKEDEINTFQRRLKDGNVWIELSGDFKCYLTLARVLVFPRTYKHVYFSCKTQYPATSTDKVYFRKCSIQ